MKKKILIGVVLLLVIIQFFRIDKTNPEINQENDFITITTPPEDIVAILKLVATIVTLTKQHILGTQTFLQ